MKALWIAPLVLAAGGGAQDPAAAPDFVRDVLPIFSARCHSCHGPEKQKSGLRLDTRASALKGGDNGPAIRPRDAAKSPIIVRVTSKDPEERMPPKGDPLSPRETGLLRRWIDAGAVWPDASAGDARRISSSHWAFQPVRHLDPPGARGLPPIDAFVLARLEKEGLAFSPPADRSTLLRRVSLDLSGLPPTPEEADAFLRDERPDAYERVVDRLLASPHYGERWARRWLDLARYADTNGYEKDRNRSIWPWRDWVIQALNDDMPFDRFTVEQLAGDLLPNATPASRIATGFHRNTMINEEGGIDVEEFRFESVVDRTATTATAWMGLTVACAQCHSHKFDPISHREYYQLFAFLDNADEPEMPVPDAVLAKKSAEAAEKIAAVEREMDARFESLRAPFDAWKDAHKAKAHRWTPLAPNAVTATKGGTFTTLPDASVLVSGDNPNNNAYTVTSETGASVTALRLEVLPHASLPDGGPGRAPLFSVGDFLLSEVTLADARGPVGLKGATQSYTEAKRSAALALDGKLDTGWSIKGRIGQAHHAVFPLERPAEGPLVLTLVQEYIHQMTIGRFRVSVTTDAAPVESSGLPADVEAALVADDEPVLRRHFLSVTPELAAEQKKIAELRKSVPRAATTMVMAERLPQHTRKTRLHHRGQFLSPKEEVEPGVPAVLPPLPEGAPRNRLAFARWLVDPAHPLTPRVVMNRHWQAFFGRGLVSTLENFGIQGAKPTHPELLDWLASEFVARNWSVKAMHRLIVTSGTYRQSSAATPALRARDPENLLLARQSRFRLEAELVRDGALTASGLLNPKIGGPGVHPPQPDGVTELAYGQPKWPASQGPDRYRRGLYTFAKRTAPYAASATFDAPSGEVCAARRDRSNTPLQALNLLNDVVFLEAARALAKAAQADPDPLGLIYRRCLVRPPAESERKALTDFHSRQLARFREGKPDPAALSGGGGAELAAWTAVARAVLNLDETITRE